MRYAHQVADVRTAERRLMDTLPEGALMQRAVAGLASVCARLLGQVYGARITVLAGSGDNGGDALYAAAALARRGAVVIAVKTASRIHEGAAGALRDAGGRLIDVTQPDPGAYGGSGPAGGSRREGRESDGLGREQDPVGRVSGSAAGGGRDGRDAEGLGREQDSVGRVSGPAVGSRGGGAGRAGLDEAAAALARADLIIDGMLGIGGRGGLREPAATLAAQAGRSGATIVAADLPSGIDADTGVVDGAAVQADVTVTFGTVKPGLLIDPAASRAGVVELIDIGLNPYLGAPVAAAVQAADVAGWLPRPSAESDKYRRGVLGLAAGSERYTGAATLATGSAIHGGAGMIRLVSEAAAIEVARQHWPETVTTVRDSGPDAGQAIEAAGRVQAWAAGPGMGTGDSALSVLRAVLASDVPVLVDADGLTVLAAHRDLLPRAAPTLITPHAGELARLLGADRADIEAHRLEYARRAAAELGVTVLLKGSTTVIADPPGTAPADLDPEADDHGAGDHGADDHGADDHGADDHGADDHGADDHGADSRGAGDQDSAANGLVLVNPTGTAWLATAGSGDVLTGLAGALLAQGLSTARAAAAAAYLHGIAARLAAAGRAEAGPARTGPAGSDDAGAPIGASDLIAALPAAIRSVTGG